MLKMNEIEIELTPDPDMYIFFEKGTRGGGHSKSTFVEEGRRASLKWEQKRTGRGGSPSMCVRSLF